jgi:hypothetical protein
MGIFERTKQYQARITKSTPMFAYLMKVIPETYLMKVIPETYLMMNISETVRVY